MLAYARPWLDAWVDAAYGTDGFWTRQQPGAHFRTGAGTGPSIAATVAGLADRIPGLQAVVDVGTGDGALLTRLGAVRPDLVLVGVDRRPRPPGLAPAVGWCQDHWDVRAGRWEHGPQTWLSGTPGPALLMAHEWLDDLPAQVVVRSGGTWAAVEVDGHGREQVAAPITGSAAAWSARWWPTGRRAELGLTRDRAWASLVAAAVPTGGSALAVDYGHLFSDRPLDGTLAAYAKGRRHPPRPDPRLNLTAHVAVDALAAAGEEAGAATHLLQRQTAVLDALVPAEAHPDPLRDLERRSQRTALTATPGWGDLWWLLQGAPSVG